jgi:hypothetical protein
MVQKAAMKLGRRKLLDIVWTWQIIIVCGEVGIYVQPIKKFMALTLSRLMTYIYMSYPTANLQTLHFIYLFNKYMYWIF